MDCPYFSIIRYNEFRVHTSPKKAMRDLTDIRGNLCVAYEFEFYYTECEGGLTVDGISHPVKPGYFTCCKPGQHRKMTLPYSCYFFNITTQNEELKAALDNLPVYSFHPEMARILELCRGLTANKDRHSLQSRMLSESYICAILSILIGHSYAVPVASDPKVRRHNTALLQANEYLREHLQEDVDLTQLARDSGLHPTYFHKLFTAAFQRTPSQQLMWYRILEAQHLLITDNLPIGEIAARCGFSTPNYFCYKFKELTGETPSRYRNHRRKKLSGQTQ